MMKSLHPGARWTFRVGTYWIFVIIFFFVGFFGIRVLLDNDLSSKYGATILTSLFIMAILAVILGEIYARLAYQCWKYEFTKTELKIEQGIIWKKYKSIPFQRIQNVEIHRGLIARIVGFSTVAIHTAGYSAPVQHGLWGSRASGAEGSIPGVSIQDAESIRKMLMSKIGKKSGL